MRKAFRDFLRKALDGIVGNRADSVLGDLVNTLRALLGPIAGTVVSILTSIIYEINILAAVILLIVGILIGGSTSFLLQWRKVVAARQTQATLKVTQDLLKLDDSLLRKIPELALGGNPEERVHRLLQEFLHDCVNVFSPDICRAAVYHRMGDFLKKWIAHAMPEETGDFYVGKDPLPGQRRGVAGVTFLTGQLLVVHVLQDGEMWRVDHDEYIPHYDMRNLPPYKAFVAIPLYGAGGASESEIIGVLCLDSTKGDMFDPEPTRRLLMTIGTRVAAAMQIYHSLESLREIGAKS